ncbi:uncharacterized protein LOC128202437 [Galleria mellonella]|uniref:Uncharacterized protein LOC128202437 n=1 Tax=Galleria mellonella TaxID=7137 RepID=A0ABM3N5G5_GALME|nr:uncharacterized protein LOC128202437 [Galleria mellonella]
MDINSLKPFNIQDGDVVQSWQKWKQIFNNYMIAMQFDTCSDERKIAILLHSMGEQCLDIYNSFSEKEKSTYILVLKSFDDYFIPKKNLAIERHKFFTLKQESDSLDTFLTKLKKQASVCEFGQLKDSLIRDMFICNMDKTNNHIREKLLTENDVDLYKLVTIYKSLELSFNSTSYLSQEIPVATLRSSRTTAHSHSKQLSTSQNGLKQQQAVPFNNNNTANFDNNKKCTRCGQYHRFKCPAKSVKCKRCHKIGHYYNLCRTPINNIEYDEMDSSLNSGPGLFTL